MSTPLHIAFFSKELPSDKPNGVSCQVHRLAQAVSCCGHAVTCFSFSGPPQDSRYTVVELPYSGHAAVTKKFAPAVAFKRQTRQPFDVYHFHGDDYLVPRCTRRVRTFYGSAFYEALHARRTGRFLYQALFYCFELVSCFHSGIKVAISARTKTVLPRVSHIIPCGVPLDRYVPGRPKTENPSLLFLGDLTGRKQGDFLVGVFHERIRKQFPSCTLTIVGPQPCSGENIEHFPGCTENDLIALYRKSWIVCVPSSYEGFGVPVIEAMACGTPAVAMKTGGVAEIITHGENGLLMEKESYAEGVVSLIADDVLRSRIMENGVSTVRNRFDIRLVAQRYIDIYASLQRPVTV